MENMKKSSKKSSVHEPSLDALTFYSIARHYCNAKTKHPHFADRVCLDEADAEEARNRLKIFRFLLQVERKQGKVCAETLAECELAEATEALARGDKKQAVSECYDTIAVLLRMIDVQKWRAALEKAGGKE